MFVCVGSVSEKCMCVFVYWEYIRWKYALMEGIYIIVNHPHTGVLYVMGGIYIIVNHPCIGVLYAKRVKFSHVISRYVSCARVFLFGQLSCSYWIEYQNPHFSFEWLIFDNMKQTML